MSIHEKLLAIQQELKVQKKQYNSFGRYHYRSCEDILEELKPILLKNKCTCFISDSLEMIGDRYYIKATANLYDIENKESISVCGYAREEESKKGMDSSQVTGASSSYARKYALNGLFCIDDIKDSDTTNKDNNTQNNANDNTANKGITDAQIKRAYTIANKKGLDEEKVKIWIKKKFNKESMKTLTKNEYDELCKALES